MATISGPQPPRRPSPITISDDSNGRRSPRPDFEDGTPSPRRLDGPPPNPPFSFPALPSPSSAPPSFSRATGRRPQSAIETPSPSFDLGPDDSQPGRTALPAFSFNPGASLPPDPLSPSLLSPPTSPNSPRLTASAQRPAGFGHRRGGSEFVGGRLRDGNSIAVMSTSPTKSESGFASPTFQPPRRGHRRGVSSAISSNDIPKLPPPVDGSMAKGSSAPTSPSEMQRPEFLSFPPQKDPPTPPEPDSVAEKPQEPIGAEEPKVKDDIPPPPESPKAKPGAKARVGFSDTLEFIPRPLSLVSSDTSSTMTARPGHSVTGSMSSLVSLGSPNEQTDRGSPSPLSRSPTRDLNESRPSTAGAILERTSEESKPVEIKNSPRRRNSIPALTSIPDTSSAGNSPAPSPSKTSKRWSFFGLDAFASSSPTKSRPHSSSSVESVTRAVSNGSSSEHGSESVGEGSESASSKSKKTRKKSKKKKRATAWAGSILPRKPKDRTKRSKVSERPPTPPASELPPDEEDEEQDSAAAQNPTPSMPTLLVTESQPQTLEDAPAKRSAEEPSTPMIDLDAALGPFNTPLPPNPEWEAAQRAAGNVGKKRLHSAQGMKGFSGPGMHYHRRAESAPDLPPFDPGHSVIHRFGSSSTMADVFEEDEEDEGSTKVNPAGSDRPSEHTSDSDGETTPPAVGPKDSIAEPQEVPPMVRRKSSGLSDKDHASARSVRAERSKTSLHDNVIIEDAPSIIFRPAVFQARPESSSSAGTSHRKCSGGKELSPVEVGSLHSPHVNNVPTSPYSTSLASSYPSPRSPMSVDAQRMSTAPSSVHDENNFQSLLMGEPGPEVRISIDYDIPSLTSSNSTMTRESAYVAHARLPRAGASDVRPVSVSSTAFGRRRSSLVSLSRLISSSAGERSKLSMEVTHDNFSDKKKPKSGKSRRLGRLMSFWKPSNKENTEQPS